MTDKEFIESIDIDSVDNFNEIEKEVCHKIKGYLPIFKTENRIVYFSNQIGKNLLNLIKEADKDFYKKGINEDTFFISKCRRLLVIDENKITDIDIDKLVLLFYNH